MRFRIRFADKIVGIFILLAILGVAAVLILLGLNQRWFARDYAFWTRFASAEGISVGMSIKLKGFEIGRVDEIRLGRDNLVEVDFHVYDTYYPKVVPGSVLERTVSALGLGTGLLLHPGPGEVPALPEQSFIPSSDVEEGRLILASERGAAPSQNDPIATLLGQVQPVLVEIDRTVVAIRQVADTLNRDLQGRGAGPLASTLKDVAGTAREVNAIASRLEAIAANFREAKRRAERPHRPGPAAPGPQGLAGHGPGRRQPAVRPDQRQPRGAEIGHRPAGRVHPFREQHPAADPRAAGTGADHPGSGPGRAGGREEQPIAAGWGSVPARAADHFPELSGRGLLMRRFAALLVLPFALAAACSTAPKPKTEVVERKERAAEYSVSGNDRYARGDYRQALTLFRLALNENLAVDHQPGVGASYNSLGKAHLALGELEQAERYFREALRLAEKLDDPRLRAQSSSNLGELELARGRASQAEELLRAAVARLPSGEPGPEQAILLHNLGAALKLQERLPEALGYFQQALALNLRQERFEEAASNHYMIASIQSKQGDTAGALASLAEALRYDRRMERSLGTAKDLAALGLLYRKQGDEAAALDAYRRSLQVYQSLSLAEEARRLLPALIELAERAGFTGEAQTYRRLAAEPERRQ